MPEYKANMKQQPTQGGEKEIKSSSYIVLTTGFNWGGNTAVCQVLLPLFTIISYFWLLTIKQSWEQRPNLRTSPSQLSNQMEMYLNSMAKHTELSSPHIACYIKAFNRLRDNCIYFLDLFVAYSTSHYICRLFKHFHLQTHREDFGVLNWNVWVRSLRSI